MADERRPTPRLKTNDVLVAAVGTAAWAVALVITLLLPLDRSEHWLRWVCVAGVAGGLFAMWFIPRIQRKRG